MKLTYCETRVFYTLPGPLSAERGYSEDGKQN